jgi:Cd2+/Zn2+-exporting ATPase
MAARGLRAAFQQALGTIVLLVPSAIFGLKMGCAVFFHERSTMVGVLNALRLLAYWDRSGV